MQSTLSVSPLIAAIWMQVLRLNKGIQAHNSSPATLTPKTHSSVLICFCTFGKTLWWQCLNGSEAVLTYENESHSVVSDSL